MKFGLDLPNMGGAGDPRLLAEIAHEAEESGWDGVFIFDSVLSPGWNMQFPDDEQKRATVDPWITLAAMAMRTSQVPLVGKKMFREILPNGILLHRYLENISHILIHDP